MTCGTPACRLCLNASGEPAEVAARADTSTRVLHDVYVHCISGQDDTVSQRIDQALGAGTDVTQPSRYGKASGYAHRRHPRPCPLSVREPVPGPAHSPQPPGPAGPQHRMQTLAATSVSAGQTASKEISAKAGDGRTRPTHSPQDTADGPRNRSLSRQKPLTQSSVTGSDLRKLVAGVGFEPT
jgi:hypothetical protein